MALLQSLLGQVTGWLAFVAALLAPGLVATVCWTPFLAAERIRSLFETLPPSGSLVPTYVLAGVGASAPFVGGLLVVLASGASGADAGAAVSERLLALALGLGAGYTVGLPVVGVVGLPRLGVDWDPTGYGASTWVLLAAGGAWYAAVFAVPLAVLGFVFVLPGGY